MGPKEPNPGLDRVGFQLRANGVPIEPPNHLRSGIHSRGYLPHVKREGGKYFVTFRLADSLPKEILLGFLEEKAKRLRALQAREAHGSVRTEARGTPVSAELIEREYHRNVERYLDRGLGACHLRRPDIAAMVSATIRHFHGRQYLLEDWVVMPNHVHLVIWPLPEFTLSEVLKGRKQFAATQANRMLGRTGERFWQPESFDHWIRNDAERSRIDHYIRTNPVTAGLCARPEDWPWSSAWLGEKSTRVASPS